MYFYGRTLPFMSHKQLPLVQFHHLCYRSSFFLVRLYGQVQCKIPCVQSRFVETLVQLGDVFYFYLGV